MRVSTTTLEGFRLYLTKDFKTEQELIASVKREWVAPRVVNLGSAWDAVLENPGMFRRAAGYAAKVEREGLILFREEDVHQALDVVERRGIAQPKLTKTYTVNGEPWTVVAKLDHLYGVVVHEFKTCWSKSGFDAHRYLDSAQPRFYLDVTGAQKVRFVVFVMSDTERDGIVLRSVEELDFWPYPEMSADCQELLEEFVRWADLRRLRPWLQDKAEDSADDKPATVTPWDGTDDDLQAQRKAPNGLH